MYEDASTRMASLMLNIMINVDFSPHKKPHIDKTLDLLFVLALSLLSCFGRVVLKLGYW